MADFDLVVTGNLVLADRIIKSGFVAVADGKIAEEWAADDFLAFVYGVGAYTPPWLSQQS